jgi:hypothetical protein
MADLPAIAFFAGKNLYLILLLSNYYLVEIFNSLPLIAVNIIA